MGCARVVKIGSPYAGEEVWGMDFTQTTDTMYLAHLDHPPTKIVRNSHTDWEFIELTFGPVIDAPTGVNATNTTANVDADNDGNSYFPQAASYIITAVNDDTGQESRGSSSDTATNDLSLKRNYNTITWTAITGATRYNVYKADNQQFYGLIGTTESTSFTDDNIGPALDKAPPVGFNPFETAGDWPSVVTQFEQRLFWARTRNRPNAVWGSRQGTSEYENHDRSRPLRVSDSLDLAMTGAKVNSVNNLVPNDQLLALTTDGVFKIDGDGEGGLLTAVDRSARRIVGRGASRLEPLTVDNVTFYSPAIGCAIRTLGYNFEYDGIRSNDVSIYSPHLFEGYTIVSWCYVEFPHSRVWAVRSDGVLLCLTWEQEQQVWGITPHETDGVVKWVAAISEEGEDRVYLAVDRDVNGTTKTLVERMASSLPTALEDGCFSDCAFSFASETPRRVFEGLHHLEGRTDIVGLLDGVPVEGLTVENGVITLPERLPEAYKATFGIPYTAYVQTLPLRITGPDGGVVVGRRQQVSTMILDLVDTGPIAAGTSAAKLYDVKSRTNENYGSPNGLMTGRYEIQPANQVDDLAEVCVRSSLPVPMTITGIYRDPDIGG